MIGFFDTSVHVALLRGAVTLESVLSQAPVAPVRLSPVVASELLRGSRAGARLSVERLIQRMVAIEPPAWGARFLDAGRLMPRIFPDFEEIGLARLQNDLLIALTARHTGAMLVTLDRHFESIRRSVRFAVRILE